MRRSRGKFPLPIMAAAFGAGLVVAMCLSFKTVAFVAALALLIVAIMLLRCN